jgi:hypothetical protein
MRPDREAWLPLRKAPAAPRKERGQEQVELSYRAKNEKSKHALFIRIPTCSLSTTFFFLSNRVLPLSSFLHSPLARALTPRNSGQGSL